MGNFSYSDEQLQNIKAETIWELYHENSKITHNSPFPSSSYITAVMGKMRESLAYEHLPDIMLPKPNEALKADLLETILYRQSYRIFEPRPLSMEQLSTLLHYSYGINRDNQGTEFSRPFRTVSSGGGLYPLELYFVARQISGLEYGLYHYSPEKGAIQLIRNGVMDNELQGLIVQPDLIQMSSIILFVTAVFVRSVFKYSERGYRFIMMEAGHMMQNYNLIATGYGFKSVNIGGYYDHLVDKFLHIDGLNHSALYMNCLGR